MKEKPLTVSEVNHYIKRVFASDFILSNISVEGEISNYNHHYSGHRYFSLKDENGRLKCVLFKNYGKSIDVDLKDGMKVVASGYISVYERNGNYQLYVKDIKESGLGDLYIAYEKLKKKLSKEGLFDEDEKKEIPFNPKTIGVVTSLTGAAIKDIITVLKRRNPSVNIVIYPSLVQGRDAPKAICEGLRYLDNREDIDLIITGRGGGSIEELFAFNDEELARTIFNMKTPIISAVGHETDFTIADFVSDLRAPTPSAAAELAVPKLETLKENIKNYKLQLLQEFLKIKDEKKNNLYILKKDLNYNSPISLLNENRQALDYMFKNLINYLDTLMKTQNSNLQQIGNKLNLLSPLSSLERGYNITIDDKNKIIKSTSNVKIDEILNIILKDGIITTKVEKIKKGESFNEFR